MRQRVSDIGSGGPAQLFDPLAIAQDMAGRLYGSEFGGGRATVFEPVAIDCGKTP